ncbi:MAG: glycine zipper 2TM domain-containing protein [Ruegeria sp.]|uniref:glycine zipper 2TM domain-containing protein n=1 Tax=Ruegeria sp. TaxID=1879320 RepID=UPI00349E5727
MKSKVLGFALCVSGLLAACAPAPTPQAQAARQHEIACLSGSVVGGLIGGAIGNQFGGGSGRDILTAAGASAGAVSGSRYAC